jgi:hypothetical protein
VSPCHCVRKSEAITQVRKFHVAEHANLLACTGSGRGAQSAVQGGGGASHPHPLASVDLPRLPRIPLLPLSPCVDPGGRSQVHRAYHVPATPGARDSLALAGGC